MHCPCGFEAPPDFAFCPRCGSKLAPATAVDQAGESERRQVTVVFADLAGFTALSESLDPEEVAALVDRCLGAMAEVVYRYGGTVDKYIGDCLMALFGAPVAHEDDPLRAIQAAIDMHTAVARVGEELAARLPSPRGIAAPAVHKPLSLRVGVNTGVVVAGGVGSDRLRSYTVLGDAVNVAARLQEAAGVGEIVVGESTFRLSSHAAEFLPLGRLALKGRSEPLGAYRVTRMLPEQRSARGLESHALVAPMIGRDEPLERLLAAFDEVLAGRARLVGVVGEAGVGKSRLIREFLGRLEDSGRLAAEGVTVRRAACSSLGEAAYGLLAALFRDAYGLAADDPPSVVQSKLAAELSRLGGDRETLDRMAPLVGHVLGVDLGEARLRILEPEEIQRQLFFIVLDLVERRLRQGPYMLVVEDLHWADAASVDLLRFLVDRLPDHRILILLTFRPSFDLGPLQSPRTVLSTIPLVPLSAAESAGLLSAMFGEGAGPLPPGLRDLLVSRAGGNPYYLEEVVRGLIDAGLLVCQDGVWTCSGEIEHVEVPPTVQGVLLSRLDRLPSAARRLVQEASILGPEFDLSLLQALRADTGSLRELLDVVAGAGILVQSPASPGSRTRMVRFSHALVQEVAYQSLLIRRRAELHLRAGEALERAHAGQPGRVEDLEALGHHFSLSAHKRKGAAYLRAAGDRARDIFANADATRFYQRAIETLREAGARPDDDEYLDVQERLGDVLEACGRRDAALECYATAREAYERRGDRGAQARLHRKIGSLHWLAGDRAGAQAEFEIGLKLLQGNGEHIELAHLAQEIGRLAFRAGDHEGATVWAREALSLGERLLAGASTPPEIRQIAAAVAESCNTLGIALARLGRTSEALEYVERCVVLAEQNDLPRVACRAYANLGVLYGAADPDRAIQTSLAGLELAKKIGDLGLQPWLYANLAGAVCTYTEHCEEEGVAAAKAAVDLDRRLGQLDHLAVPLIVLAQIYQCRGDAALALECYQEALGLAEEMREPQLLFPCYDGLATLYLEAGDEARAEALLLRANQVCEEAGLDGDSLFVLPFLG